MLNKSLRLLRPKRSNLTYPLFVFLPGMDGTGKLLKTQLDGLGTVFDIRCLSLPTNDLTNWEGLVEQTAKLIKAEIQYKTNKLVYLCGESFGGCLALKLITYAPNLFDRLILVNPASSFSLQRWFGFGASITQWLPTSVYKFFTFGLLPFLITPKRVSLKNRQALLRAMQSVTPESAAWRLFLLSQFKLEELPLHEIKQPALVIAGDADGILPSTAEAEKLVCHLPNAQKIVLPKSGHACLLEREVKLEKILREQYFLN